MKKLYWITVLGNLSNWCTALAIITAIMALSFLIWWLSIKDTSYSDSDPDFVKKFSIGTFVAFVLTLIPSAFIPSKSDLYIIYGVGSVIDYVQENPEANQLPEKTVKFLNALADKYISSVESSDQESEEDK